MSPQERIQQRRRYLMCRPDHFTVIYEINPWMNRTRATDTAKAVRQWQQLHDTYLRLGHEVDLEVKVDPSIIGGVVIRAGDRVIDGSVKGRLAQLAGALA